MPSWLKDTRPVLGNVALRWLMLSWGLWVTTEWAVLIGLSVVAFDIGGAIAVGLVGAARVLPAAVLGPFASLVTDRLPRPQVAAGVHASWCLSALALAWVAAAGAPLGMLLAVTGLGAVSASVFKACVNALLQQLVRDTRELVAANSAYSAVEAAGTVAGPLLAGLLLATLAPTGTFLGMAVLFIGGAAASLAICTDSQPARVIQARRRSILTESLRGFIVLVQPGTRLVFALFTAQSLMRGLVNVFVVVLALEGADGDTTTASLFAAIGVGGLIGAMATFGAGGGDKAVRRFAVGVSLWGAPVLVIGVWSTPEVAWWALLVLGLGNAVEDVYGYTVLNRLVPDHVAGRAFGAFQSSAAAAVALGSLCAPLLISSMGLASSMVATGAALSVAPLLLWPWLRTVNPLAGVDHADLDLLRGVPILSPMSALGIEHLARSARRVDIQQGETVVRQGEAGDGFFVVVSGEFTVSQDGRELRRLGPDDSFGEIALLDVVPRTATVTAAERCQLLCIDTASFVAAVTGHRSAALAARATVDDWRTADSARISRDAE